MNETVKILAIFIAGFLLGILFFGGLWWTTKKGLQTKSPTFWFFGSLIIRLGIITTAFYYISLNHWERALICLVGFIVARGIIMYGTRLPQNNQNLK